VRGWEGAGPLVEAHGHMRLLLALFVLLMLSYVALTAYAGFRVARGIDQAKASSIVTRVGSGVIGRDAVERIAIRRGNVPNWITHSPAFWAALRAAE
jgi:hypothetical protein